MGVRKSVVSSAPRPVVGRGRRARAIVDACEPRRLLASVSGTVFNDADKDGVRDAGEAGRSGITVFADRNYDGVMQASELRAVTDANGFYRISGIVADGTSTGIRIDGTSLTKYDLVTAPVGGAHSARFASDYEAANRNFGIATSGPSTETGTVNLAPFVDVNRNGTQDAGDTPPDVAEAWVDLDRDRVRDAGEPELFEAPPSGAPSGTPYFPLYYANLAPGTYSLALRLAGGTPGVASYAADATVTSGSTTRVALAIPPATAGPVATVSGTVYTDADKDGVIDAGEGGVGGVTVYADLNYNGVRESNEPLTTTNANGVYSLGVPLSNNSVAIRALAPTGRTFTVPSSGINSGRYSAAITYGNRNFGLAPTTPPPATGRIEITPFTDGDGNGIFTIADDPSDQRDGFSSGLSVWVDLNANGLRESNEPPLVVSFADSDRPYYYNEIFNGLATGTYEVAIRRVGDVDNYADYSVTLNVVSGQTTRAYFIIPTTSSLGGIVYNDANGNGAKDAGESGTGGVVIFADYDFDGVRDANEPQTTTNSSGVYKLYGIRSNNEPFRITALIPSGATFTNPTAGYYQARFDRAYDLADQGGRDFGYKAAAPAANASVSGVVWTDTDASGQFEYYENAAGGVTVYADLNYNGVREAGEPTAVTGSDGKYTLSIPTGPNSVAIRLDGVATNRITAPAGGFYSGKYPAPYKVENAWFGVAPAAVTGRVFLDADRDGVRDAGEGWAAGAVVFADIDGDGVFDYQPFGSDNDPYAVVDANGFYTIRGPAGVATAAVGIVNLIPPYYGNGAGFIEGSGVYAGGRGFIGTTPLTTAANPLLGAVGASLIGVFPKTSSTSAEPLMGPGAGRLSNQVELALIGSPGYGFLDANANGLRDAGETTVAASKKYAADEDRYFGFEFVVADGASFRFGLSRGFEVGAPANAIVSGVGSPGVQKVYEPEVTPTQSVVYGRVSYDNNRDGVPDGAMIYNEDYARVFADYDHDGVLDADEPSTSPNDNSGGEDRGVNGYFFLGVQPGREFTLRVIPREHAYGEYKRPFVQSPTAPRLSVPANTLVGAVDVSYYLLDA